MNTQVKSIKRAQCHVCLRAKRTCICNLFTEVKNTTHVIVLQHPTEVKQTKGSITLLKHSLTHCDVFVGENFADHFADNKGDNVLLSQLLHKYKDNVALLYPSEDATVVTHHDVELIANVNSKKHALKPPQCIILIDGTWKKSYKMFMVNTFLHQLPHITLPTNIECDYRIRKTKKTSALSSLEACAYALGLLEGNINKYQTLLARFSEFNDLQLAFRTKQ